MVVLHIHSEPGALFLIFFLWNLPLVLARIVNRTIDDQFGDSDTFRQVTYLSTTSDVWGNQSCGGCLIQPDISRAFKGTYTAAFDNTQRGPMNITMIFNGMAIYVFFILANNVGNGISSLTVANFTLDGTNPELFLHAPDLTRTEIDYNQLVYSKQDLINAEHTLVISTFGVNADVYVNFDYAIYTHDDDAPLLPLSTSPFGSPLPPAPGRAGPSSEPKCSPPVGPIVGGVIGVLFFFLVACLLLFRRIPSASEHHRLSVESYVRPSVEESINRQATIITPFNAQPRPLPFLNASGNRRGYNKDSPGALPHQIERADPNSIEAIWRTGQNEIDERLQVVQQEAAHLTSDLRGEMSIEEIMEQLHVMEEQIGHLRDQQRSAWLSDAPLPGYTLNPALRNPGPTAVPSSS